MTTFNPNNADMSLLNQISDQIKEFLDTRELKDLEPIRPLADQARKSGCADTIIATFGYVTGGPLTDDEAAHALDMPADDVRTMRRITRAIGDPSPQAAAVRADTRRQMAQAA